MALNLARPDPSKGREERKLERERKKERERERERFRVLSANRSVKEEC